MRPRTKAFSRPDYTSQPQCLEQPPGDPPVVPPLEKGGLIAGTAQFFHTSPQGRKLARRE